jgi:RHS repeat-associated protein
MSEGARKGSPASSALSLLLLVAPLLAPAALASVPRGAAALSSPSLAADVDVLATSSLEHNDSAPFRVFAGDELGDAHVLVFELSYPKTRVGGLGLPDEARVGAERSLRLEAPWACDGCRCGKASGSGEFRIFDAAGTSRSTSAFGWNRLFQGREYIGLIDAYDFRARTLWPELGRFGQEDPAGTVDSTNRYQALLGDWSGRIDPLGLRTYARAGGELPCAVFPNVNYESGSRLLDETLFAGTNTIANVVYAIGNTAPVLGCGAMGLVEAGIDRADEFAWEHGWAGRGDTAFILNVTPLLGATKEAQFARQVLGTFADAKIGRLFSTPPARPEWLTRVIEGNRFNETQRKVYPVNELYIKRPNGRYVILDSYNPITGEIVSRKFTQLANVKPETAISYLRELAVKYPSGSTIAGVRTTPEKLKGAVLSGTQILEVPVQERSIPGSILAEARKLGILIRDVAGKVYN